MGGMERASVNTAHGLSKYADVVFVTVLRKPHFFNLNQGIELEEPDGFNVTRLSMSRTIGWLRQVVNKHKPDRVFIFNKFYAALTSLALMGIKVPVYISERSSPLYEWSRPFRWIHRIAFTLKPPTGVMAQTSIAAEYQQMYYKSSKIKVIPNVLREVTLYPEIERQPIILAVGRLGDHLKGFDLLIESFALLKNKQWELHIAGGDENGAELKQQAKILGVFDRIRFLGKVQDIDKVYAKAGIYIMPSRSEGFPNALAEAMATGCACVAFDFIAGPRDMIEDGISGIIVENGHVRALAEEIDDLIEKPELRKTLGEAAMSIKNKLNEEVIMEEIIEFLDLK